MMDDNELIESSIKARLIITIGYGIFKIVKSFVELKLHIAKYLQIILMNFQHIIIAQVIQSNIRVGSVGNW